MVASFGSFCCATVSAAESRVSGDGTETVSVTAAATAIAFPFSEGRPLSVGAVNWARLFVASGDVLGDGAKGTTESGALLYVTGAFLGAGTT